MGEPVIIDDGGSTRIKQLKRNDADGRLDDLLIPGNSENAKGVAPFGTLKIVFLDEHGVLGTPISPAFAKGDVVTIRSANLQDVKAELTNAKKLVLSLAAGAANLEPMVHAKQNGDQRRYVISNAGSIQKIDITKNGSTIPDPPVFDATDTTRPESASIYTMVLFT